MTLKRLRKKAESSSDEFEATNIIKQSKSDSESSSNDSDDSDEAPMLVDPDADAPPK
ncbi:unnamed protein product, partial [Anisakis simplex]|uniref:Transposase n=1 Tax=Anisakis simplex TaxID=6269 RepID=A0A0M3J609_ANISI